ncbi:MAG: thymidylate kinase [Gemmatimonadales bacterium]|nr:Thymidylate kinase [bacterium HR33]GIW52621.1 MAG: thymidylate kinase [Gemmatimonadales bacterium]
MQHAGPPGKLIAFEGLDGSGQTTQAKLLTLWLDQRAGMKAHYTKEPTSGPIGTIIKRALLQPDHTKTAPELSYNPATLALLFAADRLDHLEREILPLLRRGTCVISDRYTISSLAYQSLELDPKWVRSINRYALSPDLTIFLNVPLKTCLDRIRNRHPQPELYENPATLQRVEHRYRQIIRALQRQRYRIEIVDGTPPPAEVHRAVVEATKKFFRKRRARPREDEDQIAALLKTPPLNPEEIRVHLAAG